MVRVLKNAIPSARILAAIAINHIAFPGPYLIGKSSICIIYLSSVMHSKITHLQRGSLIRPARSSRSVLRQTIRHVNRLFMGHSVVNAGTFDSGI